MSIVTNVTQVKSRAERRREKNMKKKRGKAVEKAMLNGTPIPIPRRSIYFPMKSPNKVKQRGPAVT